jgi:cell volume regulation protein A
VTPSRLPDQGFEPVIVAFALVLVARPLAVLASTLGQRFDWHERAFLSWAGLRGAVPIVFATFPVVAGVEDSLRIFDVVFYVVVVSVVVQGLGLRPVAAMLGVADERPAVRMAEIDVATLRSLGAELVELDAGTAGIDAGRPLRDLRLPGGGIVAAIRRGDQIVPPRGSTVVETGDRLYLLVERERLEEVERALSG